MPGKIALYFLICRPDPTFNSSYKIDPTLVAAPNVWVPLLSFSFPSSSPTELHPSIEMARGDSRAGEASREEGAAASAHRTGGGEVGGATDSDGRARRPKRRRSRRGQHDRPAVLAATLPSGWWERGEWPSAAMPPPLSVDDLAELDAFQGHLVALLTDLGGGDKESLEFLSSA